MAAVHLVLSDHCAIGSRNALEAGRLCRESVTESTRGGVSVGSPVRVVWPSFKEVLAQVEAAVEADVEALLGPGRVQAQDFEIIEQAVRRQALATAARVLKAAAEQRSQPDLLRGRCSSAGRAYSRHSATALQLSELESVATAFYNRCDSPTSF